MFGLIWWDPETKRQWRWSGTLWQLVAAVVPPLDHPFDPNTRLNIRVFNKQNASIKIFDGDQEDASQNFVTVKQVG